MHCLIIYRSIPSEIHVLVKIFDWVLEMSVESTFGFSFISELMHDKLVKDLSKSGVELIVLERYFLSLAFVQQSLELLSQTWSKEEPLSIEHQV